MAHAAKTVRERLRKAQEKLGRATWSRLSFAAQRALVAEIVYTRRRELRLACTGVLTVGHGLRTRRTAKARKSRSSRTQPGRVVDEPCVVFIVKRKWPFGTAGKGRPVPPYLLSYTDTRRGRRLCSVPTDVRCATEFNIVPHAGSGDLDAWAGENGRDGLQLIRVTDGVHTPQKGTFCCAVRDPDTDRLFGLSCHHVLAMSLETSPPGAPADAEVRLRVNEEFIGELDFASIGLLTKDPAEWSFDAALCRIRSDAIDTFRSACGAIRPSDWLKQGENAPLFCSVMTATKGTLRAKMITEIPDWSLMRYFATGPQPHQRRILELEIESDRTTEEGDSGCAILNRNEDTLVGMHIGGAENSRRIFAIPAYHLLDGVNWKRNSDLVLASDF